MSVKQQILDIIEVEEAVEEGALVDRKSPSVEDIRQLKYLVENGHWESLAESMSFLALTQADRVHTMIRALNNRAQEVRRLLTPMARKKDTHAAYIQMLNHVNDLEGIAEDLLDGHYSSTGARQISEKSEDEPYGFY